MDYSPWGCKESDMTEHAHMHSHLCHNDQQCNRNIVNFFYLMLVIYFITSSLITLCLIYFLESLVAWWWRICLQCRRHGFNPWVRKIPWRRKRQPIPIFLHGEYHGQRSLVGYSPWDRKELNTTWLLNHHLLVILFIYRTMSPF